ncbi:TIGR03915 family putative DNA repair protein [Acidovorax sp. GBBC 3334]|uniref:TIGR03915 family putative DNA repair protein n=1 Tax=Acidovorax sp. GBBC 3334 TaxID=2940496 RepID=UPI0023034197|nr:TIGR03915 family putative DNA repair protein [Acidovorax sp. GBBC 3334]MDA8456501.1 TIGR03915 family putative DNA repair protein [Acidovorax sp. GBBC 3334]
MSGGTGGSAAGGHGADRSTGRSDRTVVLAHPTDWPGFRQAARALLQQGCPPDAVHWSATGDSAHGDLFAEAGCGAPMAGGHLPGSAAGFAPVPDGPAEAAATSEAPRVPAAFLPLGERVVLHRDPARFALLYRLLWRLVHEPGLRADPLDPDRLQAGQMARAVARDVHKMRAFVRFRPVPGPGGEPLHVAWFEPDHRIAVANAPFFVRRFTQMRWAILTPDASVHWDGTQLHTGPGASRADAPAADDGEALWLTYYRNTFNPARLKMDMMRREMPTRYWKNLPEAALIGELAQGAAERSGRMVDAPGTVPRRRIAGQPVAGTS